MKENSERKAVDFPVKDFWIMDPPRPKNKQTNKQTKEE